MKKIVFALGMLVGYVLGTRAGRERYEQIKRAAATFWESSLVRRGRASVGDYTSGIRSSLQDSVVDAARNLVQAVLQFTKQAPAESAPPAERTPSASTAKAAPAQKRSNSTSKPKPGAEPKPKAKE